MTSNELPITETSVDVDSVSVEPNYFLPSASMICCSSSLSTNGNFMISLGCGVVS